MVASDGQKLFFDSKDGKYGYNTDPNRGADTFHPFNGSEYLRKDYTTSRIGYGHSAFGVYPKSATIDIKSDYPDKYKNMTINNMVLVVSNVATYSGHAPLSSSASMSYDSNTGIITLTDTQYGNTNYFHTGYGNIYVVG